MGLFGNDVERIKSDINKFRGMKIPCFLNKADATRPGILRIPKKTGWKPIVKSDAERVRKDSARYPGMTFRARSAVGSRPVPPGSDRTDVSADAAAPPQEEDSGCGQFIQTGLEWFRYR